MLAGIGRVFTFARETQDLYALQAKTKDALVALDERLRLVEDRLTRLEAEQGHVISEAKTAATSAATMIAGAVISDTVTRVTRVEERMIRLAGGMVRVIGDAGGGL